MRAEILRIGKRRGALPLTISEDTSLIVIESECAGMSPFEAASSLSELAPNVPIAIVVSPADEEANVRAVDAGAWLAVEPARVPSLIREYVRSADPAHDKKIAELSTRFDLAPIGIVTTSMHGRWIYPNRRLCEQLGYTREELAGKSFIRTTHPEDRQATLYRWVHVVSGSRTKASGEKRYIRKDGSTMWANVTTTLIRDSKGEIDFFVTTIEDITPRYVAEERVRLQARLLACAEEAIVATDSASSIIYWNPSAERLFGWSADEVAGRDVTEIVSTSLTPEQRNEFRSLVHGGETWRGEIDLFRRDGTSFPASVTDSPIFDTAGKLIGIVGISCDITARRANEQAVNRRYSQLQATTDLGRLALRGVPLDELFRFAATCLCAVLDTDVVEISKQSDGDMLLVGGNGWGSGEIGTRMYSVNSDYAVRVLGSDEAVVHRDACTEKGIVSSLAMRIAGSHDTAWGLVGVHVKRPRSFDVDDTLFLISIANVLGDAIHRRVAEMELRTRADQQSAIAELSGFALAANSDAEIIDAACTLIGTLLDVEHPIFLEYDMASEALFAAGGKPWIPPQKRGTVNANGESLAGYVLKLGETVIVADYAKETRFDAARLFVSYGIVSGIAAPVRGARMTLGVLAAQTRRARRFTASDGQFVQAIGNVLAQALERNVMRRDLAESEGRYRAVVEGAAEVIFSADPNGLITSLNPAFTSITGWTRGEWIGQPMRDLILIPDRERFDKAFAHLVRGEAVDGAEMRLRGKTRGILVDTNAFARDVGGRREIYGFARDVTAARAAEEERRRLLLELQLLLDSTDEGIYAVDTEGRCTLLNRAAAKILGYRNDELFGENIHQMVHSLRLDGTPNPESECTVYRILRGAGASRGSDEVFWTAAGKPIVVDYSASPIISDGFTRGVVVTFTDITERRKLEAQLEQAKRLGSLGRLAATVAHEFNNVLMSISPYAEIVRRDSSTTRGSNACEQIMKAVRRGKGITEEILQFTQPNDPRSSSVDVCEWVDGFASDIRSVLGSRFEVSVKCESDLPHISADTQQLYQAFTNLAANARDAMPQGGTIEIGARRESKSTVFSFGVVHKAEQFVHFWIKDRGCGMKTEVLQHIFEPLFTTKRNGTGIGLAVTHQVVERHGGELFVESRVSEGTTFHLFMPIAKSTTIAVPAEVKQTTAKRARFRNILIVEDEPAVAEGIAAVLRLEGTTVDIVGTGAAALERVAASCPDAVILDVGLPDMDGRKVYERLATIAPLLPVVFSTGHEASRRTKRAMSNTAWLMKPYELDVLLNALDTLASAL
jgi:PAS domain S-box-containing protein